MIYTSKASAKAERVPKSRTSLSTKDIHMIHILIAILILTGQHRLPKPPVHHDCKTCTWVMQ